MHFFRNIGEKSNAVAPAKAAFPKRTVRFSSSGGNKPIFDALLIDNLVPNAPAMQNTGSDGERSSIYCNPVRTADFANCKLRTSC